jgi:hypothetical protein
MTVNTESMGCLREPGQHPAGMSTSHFTSVRAPAAPALLHDFSILTRCDECGRGPARSTRCTMENRTFMRPLFPVESIDPFPLPCRPTDFQQSQLLLAPRRAWLRAGERVDHFRSSAVRAGSSFLCIYCLLSSGCFTCPSRYTPHNPVHPPATLHPAISTLADPILPLPPPPPPPIPPTPIAA